jgi:signal transduction histidine kinase
MPSADDRTRRLLGRGRIGRRLVISFVLLVTALVAGSSWLLHGLARRSLERQMSEHLVSVAQLVATVPDGEVLSRLQPGSEGFRLYRNLATRLRWVRELVGARRVYVFDREGRSLLDTEDGWPIGREYPHLKVRDRLELARVWQGAPVHSVLFHEGPVYYMSGYAPVYAGGQVVAAVGVDVGAGFMGAIQLFRRSILIFAGVGVVLTVVVALVLAGTLTRPIQRLVTAAREIGRGNLALAVDTSARDELGYLAETMEEMRRKLLARDAQLRQMLAGVAHEIRNPLGGIEIYAGLIADDLPAADPRKQHIQKVIDEVRTLNRVITEFLEFARPVAPSPEWTPVARLVDDAAFLLGPEMERAGVELHQDVPAELRVYADAEQVKRALANLMKNAVQAMRNGGRLRVWGRAVDGEIVLEVEDTGAGMDAQTQQRLFEPFFTTREQGSGLGLAIVRRSVEENGGRVELKRTGAGGTVIQLVLPGRIWHEETETGK